MPPAPGSLAPVDLETTKRKLTETVKDAGLGRFFKDNDENNEFLGEVAVKVVRHISNEDTPPVLKEPENIEHLVKLALYRPIFYCDDSLSMNNKAYKDQDDSPSRYDVQKALVSCMADIATMVAPNNCNVDLHFINLAEAVRENLPKEPLLDILEGIKPQGQTMLGTVLDRDILAPFVYDTIGTTSGLPRPLLICIITDGLPMDKRQNTVRRKITVCRKRLESQGYTPASVMYCISLIGDDPEATKFLDDLRKDSKIRNVLHCTTDRLDERYRELRDNHDKLDEWLLKTLSEPIMMKLDSVYGVLT